MVARLVVKASERTRAGEDRLAAVKRAFKHLTEEEIQAVLDQVDLDPSVLRPARPSWGQAFSLAFPLGLGMFLFTLGCLGILGQCFALALSQLLDASPGVAGSQAAAIQFAVMVAAMCVGVGLQRLERWARAGALGVGLFACSVGFVDAATSATPMLVSVGLCCLAIALLRPVRRWFEPEARASARALPLKGHAGAAAWLSLVFAVLVFVVPAFKKMFEETGIRLPWGAEQVIWASNLATDYALLVPLGVVLGLAPLLRVDAEHELTMRVAAWTVGGAAFATVGGWLALAAYRLVMML